MLAFLGSAYAIAWWAGVMTGTRDAPPAASESQILEPASYCNAPDHACTKPASAIAALIAASGSGCPHGGVRHRQPADKRRPA